MTSDGKREGGRVGGRCRSRPAPIRCSVRCRPSGRDTARSQATAEMSAPRRAGTATASSASAAGSRATAVTTGRTTSPAAVGLLDPPGDASPMAAPARSGPCAEERRLADERCALATRAQARGAVAAGALRLAQRAYDTHTAAAKAAAEAGDPRAVRTAKRRRRAAGIQIRVASRAAASAGSPGGRGSRPGLREINRINPEARGRGAATASGSGRLGAPRRLGPRGRRGPDRRRDGRRRLPCRAHGGRRMRRALGGGPGGATSRPERSGLQPRDPAR